MHFFLFAGFNLLLTVLAFFANIFNFTIKGNECNNSSNLNSISVRPERYVRFVSQEKCEGVPP